jgi:DNA polymerase III subunit gamma/tau
MEHFVVSARKYRPSTFHLVVGQSHITTTLKNAIRDNHVAQAFLFCGPRGVGKTTTARILAKTINCSNLRADIEPCNECVSCQSFINGQSMNIFELDGASNNSVEDMRNLIEQVRFAPQLGRYRIFIIDEVHMLSAAAFNAFLKTLEEPPVHCIFILATTEKHKVIATILSRCQIFEFNRIKAEDIANQLNFVAQSEGISAEMEALMLIAQKADGGMRDALSMFDQLVTFAGKNLTYEAVVENLNIIDYDYFFRLTDLILKGDISGCLLLLNDVMSLGFEPANFVGGLAAHLRDLMVARDPSTLVLLSHGQSIKEKYKSQSIACAPSFLVNASVMANRAEFQQKSALNPRLVVELCLMQLCVMAKPPAEAEKKKSELKEEPAIDDKATNPNPPKVQSEISSEKNAVPAATAEPKPESTPAAPSSPEITSTAPTNKHLFNPPPLNLKTPLAKVGEVAKQEAKSIQERNTPFSSEDLNTAWEKFVAFAESTSRTSISNLMRSCSLTLLNDTKILVKIANKTQETMFIEVLPEIGVFLKDHLKNDFLSIQLEVDKNEVDKKPYTNTEKFRYLATKNENLELLRRTLDLEI